MTVLRKLNKITYFEYKQNTYIYQKKRGFTVIQKCKLRRNEWSYMQFRLSENSGNSRRACDRELYPEERKIQKGWIQRYNLE